MIDTEQIKKDGAIRALKDAIHALQFRIGASAWNNTIEKDHYYRLGEAISDVRVTLQEMEQALAALQELAPENK